MQSVGATPVPRDLRRHRHADPADGRIDRDSPRSSGSSAPAPTCPTSPGLGSADLGGQWHGRGVRRAHGRPVRGVPRRIVDVRSRPSGPRSRRSACILTGSPSTVAARDPLRRPRRHLRRCRPRPVRADDDHDRHRPGAMPVAPGPRRRAGRERLVRRSSLLVLADVPGTRARHRSRPEVPARCAAGCLGPLVLAGILDVLGLISFVIGLERAPTWLVGLASSFGPAVTIIFAVAFLGDDSSRSSGSGSLGRGPG